MMHTQEDDIVTKFNLEQVYNAIATFQEDSGTVEVIGIRNAFVRAMMEESKIFVLTEKIEYLGENASAFVILNDGEGHVVFPLFTDLHELMPIKQSMEWEKRLDVSIMELSDVLMMLVSRELCDGVVVNPASLNFSVPLAFCRDVLSSELTSHVTLIHADITELHTDAIVSSTDESISGAAGVDAAIQAKGGEVLREQVREQQLGLADVMGIRKTGDLHAKYVFFTRAPAYSENMSLQALYDCYYNCMNVAQQSGSTSIAFPCIGAGQNGIPMELVIEISTKAVIDWLGEHEDYRIDVYFCCYEEGHKEMYQAYFDSIA